MNRGKTAANTGVAQQEQAAAQSRCHGVVAQRGQRGEAGDDDLVELLEQRGKMLMSVSSPEKLQ